MEKLKCMFFVEGVSDKAFLEGMLPRLRKDLLFQIKSFEGKSDLKKNIAHRVRAWREGGTCLFVLVDKDAEDCKKLKKSLLRACQNAASRKVKKLTIRIACSELESWYLGDLQAASQAFQQVGLAQLQNKKVYRQPDRLPNPAQILKKLVKRYQKVDGARRMGQVLSVKAGVNRSASFEHFIKAISEL